MQYKIIDLFSGAGGLSSGFLENNKQFKSILAIDNDQSAVDTYNSNFGNHCICVDIEEWVKTAQIPQADIVLGGPPCQGFSLLNKKREGDARRALWEPYMEIVKASGASLFVMENVQGLLKSQEFSDILTEADKQGFHVKYQLLNTADYGVPQTRKRAIVFGVKKQLSEILNTVFPPTPTHNSPTQGFLLPHWVTVKAAIDDLKEPVGTEIRHEEKPPYNLHFGRNPTELSMARYKSVPVGGNRFDLQKNAPELTPKCWLNKPTGSTDLFGRLWWNRPSVTIRTEFYKPEKGRYLHPEKHRPITHREAARLMSFSDNFIFKGSKTDIARQIGNAVPPELSKAISKTVISILKSKKQRAA